MDRSDMLRCIREQALVRARRDRGICLSCGVLRDDTPDMRRSVFRNPRWAGRVCGARAPGLATAAAISFCVGFLLAARAPAQEMVYQAEISAADRVNSRGAPLRTLREFLRQDRYNVHSGRHLDPGDIVDPFFGNARARELIDSARLETTPGLEREVAAGRVTLVEVGVSRSGNRLQIEVRPAGGGMAGGGAPAPAPAARGGAGAAPEGAVVYRAEISAADRVNSRGAALGTLREYLRQDRFNVHSGRHQDPGDTLDPVFGSAEARAFIDGARLVVPEGLEAAVAAGRVSRLEVALSESGGRLEMHVRAAEDAGAAPMAGGLAGGGGVPTPGSPSRAVGDEAGAAHAHGSEVPEGYLAVYATTLGHGDFVDSNGEPLPRLRDWLQRDRTRVNLLGEPDPGDERDGHFVSPRQLRQFFERAELFVDPALLPRLRARQATPVVVHAAFDNVLYVSDPAAAGEVEVARLEDLVEERDFEAGAMAAARAPGAEEALRELAELSELAHGRAHGTTATFRVTLATLLLEQGRAEEVRDSLPGIERDFREAAQRGVDPASIYPVMGFLANAHAALGDAGRAEALFAELLDEPGSRSWRLGEEDRERLGDLRARLAGGAGPEEAYREALAAFRELDADPLAGSWERLEALNEAVFLHPTGEGEELDALFADLEGRLPAGGAPVEAGRQRILAKSTLGLVLRRFDRGEFDEAARWSEALVALTSDPAASEASAAGEAGLDEARNLPGYARYLHVISLVGLGKAPRAERLAGEYFAWAKAHYEPYDEVLYNLGGLSLEFFVDRGDAAAVETAAEDLAVASVAAEEVVGTMLWHGLIAESCFAAGDIERSDLWFSRLVAALEASEPMRPALPEAYSGWGHLHEGAGRYGRAEAIWTEGAERAEADPALFEGYLDLQQDLSLIRKHYRDEAGAVAILERARDLAAEAIGRDSKQYATSCNNLVLALHNLGRRDEALRMSDESLRVAASHPDRAWGEEQTLTYRNNRGILMMATDPAAAAGIYESIVSAAEGSGLAASEELTFYLMNLGAALNRSDRLEESEAAYARALELMRSFARPYGRNLSIVLEQLAKFALARGDAGAAAEFARESVATMEAFFDSASAFASESERLALGSLHRQGSAIHVLVAAGAVEEACQISLRIKGMVLDRSIREARAIRSLAEDAEARRLFESLRARQRQLNRVALELERRGSADPSLPVLSELRQEVRRLEAELLERSEAEDLGAAGLAEVRRRLGDEGAFIEFVLASDEHGEDYLGAFEITRDELRWVRLESEERTQAAVAEFRGAIDALMAAPDDAQWAAQGERLEIASSGLYGMLWAPFESSVSGRKRVVLSPDGPLHFVPFAALLDAEGRFAGEERVIEYVVSARDFCREERVGERRMGSAVVVGGPDYVAPLAEGGIAPEVAVDPAAAERAGERHRAFSGIARSGEVALEPLPGAEKEAGLVAQALAGAGVEVTLLTAGEASERAVVDAAVPGILHIATHGIFFDLGFDSLVSGEFRIEVDPMLRGALAFAGAEHALNLWEAGEFPDPDDDGWLFAAEAAQLDLRGTALVTLSACDTGIGSIAAGEGVVGLRRSFLAAGAGSVLSTLWPIADEYTVALMNGFYQEVGAGRPVAEAFAESQGKALARFREQGERASAILLFGAFVLNTSGG